MLTFMGSSEKKKHKICLICNERLTDIASSPDICRHLFHYKCIRTYVDNRLEKKEPIVCPEKGCRKFFGRIANKYKNSEDLIYQNVLLSNDENQCCICFLKYKIPVASSDSCLHSFCCDCLKKWCTFKHECPMDRVPIKMLLISDFPGGHITSKMEPPPIEQDLNGDGDNDELVNTTCEVCNSGQDEDQLLLCDNCNRGYHIYCLPVPLNNIPEGDWFCSQCDHNVSNSQEETPESGGFFRGLGRIIDNIQVRHVNNSTANNTQRRRNNANNRRSRTSARTVRNTRLEGFIVESEDEWSPDEVAISTLRTRASRLTGGVRTRSGRRLEYSSEEEIDSEHTMSPIHRQSPSMILQSVVTEEPMSETVITTARVTHTPNLRTVQRRRRQGSLSSNIESEAEPIRKRRRLTNGHDHQLSDDEEDNKSSSYESSIDEENHVTLSPITTRRRAREIRETPSPITTRRRAREIQESQERDEYPERPVMKLSRIIDDDSEDEQLTDEQLTDEQLVDEQPHSCSSHVTKRKRLIIGSESSQDESEDERVRHVSTSSSISTIPCRMPDLSELVTELRPRVARRVTRTKPKKAVKRLKNDFSASTSDSTMDERDGTWLPSTSTQPNHTSLRRSKRKSSSTPARRSSRPRKPKRSYDEESSDAQKERSISKRVGGRENHGDEQVCVLRDRSFNSGGSILSEINDGDTNLRHPTQSSSSVSAKKDKIVLTIKNIHVTNTNNNALESIYQVLPHNITTHLPDQGPSTSLSSSPKNTISYQPPTSPRDSSVITESPHTDNQSSSRTLAPQPSTSSSRNSSLAPKSHNEQPSTSSSSRNSSVAPTSHKKRDNNLFSQTDVVNLVSNILNAYLSDSVIDDAEYASLSDRIVEKIAKKNGTVFEKSKIKKFVIKYLQFFLDRRKKGIAKGRAKVTRVH